MNPSSVEFLHANANVRVGSVVVSVGLHPIYGPAAMPVSVDQNNAVFVQDSPFPADAQAAPPHLSGKIGDGTLLKRLLDAAPAVLALLAQFGLLKVPASNPAA